jgi:hypothetical protein
MNQAQIERRIEHIKKELTELGPMHPGSISEQFNVCGTAGCHCKDPNNPQRHGPYYQLSYGWRGKSSSRFIRPARIVGMRGKVTNYKRLRELVNEWVDLSLELERIERAAKKEHGD